MSYRQLFFYGIVILLMQGCGYKQNIMFKTDTEVNTDQLERATQEAQRNYVIQINDQLRIQVFTNKGERIIDPDYELFNDISQNQANLKPDPEYLVQADGTVDFPMVGIQPMAGLTLAEARELLEKEYQQFYNNPYVIVEYLNKRVIVLGQPGGQVVPIQNEQTTLLEVIALAGGLDNDSKAQNIRLVRGDFQNPEVFLIDLSTIEGLTKAPKYVQPGDVIYIEPIRRPVSEATRDFLPVVTALATLTTLLVVILQN